MNSTPDPTSSVSSMPRFSARIALEQAVPLTPAAIEAAAAELGEKLSGVRASATDAGLTVDVAGTAVEIHLIETPIPDDRSLQRALAMNQPWQELADALARSKAHIEIAAPRPAHSRLEAVRFASAITLAAAAVCKVAPSLVTFWPTAPRIQPPHMTIEEAKRLLEGFVPIGLWLQLIPGRRQRIDGSHDFDCVTDGLRWLCGFEIEFAHATGVAMYDMAARVLGLAQQTIGNGPETFPEGSIFGIADNDRLRVHYAQSHVRPGIPTIELVPEQVVPGVAIPDYEVLKWPS